jgi:hypothetical protein
MLSFPSPCRATRVVVGALGALVGLARVEHGVGEVLQGRGRPAALVIQSWPAAAGFEILSGEPAMTVVSDLLVTGVLAIAIGLTVAVWSIWFVGRPPSRAPPRGRKGGSAAAVCVHAFPTAYTRPTSGRSWLHHPLDRRVVIAQNMGKNPLPSRQTDPTQHMTAYEPVARCHAPTRAHRQRTVTDASFGVVTSVSQSRLSVQLAGGTRLLGRALGPPEQGRHPDNAGRLPLRVRVRWHTTADTQDCRHQRRIQPCRPPSLSSSRETGYGLTMTESEGEMGPM